MVRRVRARLGLPIADCVPPRAGLAHSTLARNASSYLVNFASKDDPDSADSMSWPKIDQNQPQTMELGFRLGPGRWLIRKSSNSEPVITIRQSAGICRSKLSDSRSRRK